KDLPDDDDHVYKQEGTHRADGILKATPPAGYTCQSIGSRSCFFKNSFVFEKCLHPKKPWCAENGDGWAAVRTWCLRWSMSAALFLAYRPHNRKTTPCLWADSSAIALSVNASHPLP